MELTGPVLTAATAFSLIRVFSGDEWAVWVALAGAVGHLLALAVRRMGGSAATSILVSGVGLVLAVTWAHYRDTAVWGLPLGDTWAALGNDLEQAWGDFGDLSPPVEPVTGFTVSAMAAVWLLATVSDWTAMRTRALFETMVLPIVAFGFVGLVGDDRHRLLTIGVFTAALLLFATVHRVADRTAGAAWLGGKSRASSGRRAMLGAGAMLGAVAVAGAVLAGPAVSSSDDPVVDLSEAVSRDGPGTGRVVISPLVDIRGRLVTQSDTVVFEVRSKERSYWRLTALDEFDGQVWTSRANYNARPTQLPSLFQSGSSVQESVQEFTILQLGAVWLPAAFEPRSLVSDTTDISYEPSSSTLIVDHSLPSSDGLTYTITSALPRFDPATLERISTEAGSTGAGSTEAGSTEAGTQSPVPSAPVEAYTSLPPDFSPSVRNLAAEITAGAGSGYGQALALQGFFRNGDFTYDANVAPGHSGNRIENFLAARRGYCEQFAGTFAAMARSVGLPARVAVGFTVGEADPDDPDLYRVQGRHAHAWPEVFVDGVGWVAFEPTPGRGAPGAQNYTGVAENQVGGSPNPAPGEAEPSGDAEVPLEPPADLESLPAPDAQAQTTLADASGGGMTGGAWAAVLAPMLAVLALLGIPGLKRLQRRRRLQRATGNRGKIRLLWLEAVESLALINMAPRPDETYAEFAGRAITQVPLHSPDLRQLGELAAAAAFAPAEPADQSQWLARTWSVSVRSEVSFRVTWWQKLTAALNPRPLFSRPR